MKKSSLAIGLLACTGAWHARAPRPLDRRSEGVDPLTAMPLTGVAERDARDIATYLTTVP